MKIPIAKAKLAQPDLIWQELTEVIIHHQYPSEHALLDQMSIVYLYYSEMESGGHEAVFNWQYEQIVAYGFNMYYDVLTSTLKQIGAADYAAIVEKYLPSLWDTYNALEQNDQLADAFYVQVEIADKAYNQLHDAIRPILEKTAIKVYLDVFEPIE